MTRTPSVPGPVKRACKRKLNIASVFSAGSGLRYSAFLAWYRVSIDFSVNVQLRHSSGTLTCLYWRVEKREDKAVLVLLVCWKNLRALLGRGKRRRGIDLIGWEGRRKGIVCMTGLWRELEGHVCLTGLWKRRRKGWKELGKGCVGITGLWKELREETILLLGCGKKGEEWRFSYWCFERRWGKTLHLI